MNLQSITTALGPLAPIGGILGTLALAYGHPSKTIKNLIVASTIIVYLSQLVPQSNA